MARNDGEKDETVQDETPQPKDDGSAQGTAGDSNSAATGAAGELGVDISIGSGSAEDLPDAVIPDEDDESPEVEAQEASVEAGSASSSSAEVSSADESSDPAAGGSFEVPFELQEDRPDPGSLPETGLVSEFVDVSRRQAAWLVSNRESSTVLRSPAYLIAGAVVVLGILAAVITAFVNTPDDGSGATPTMAMVGVGDQAAMYEQQLGVKITDAADPQAAEKLVREGKVDAAFIQDPSGQAQPTIIALNEQPEALLEKLAPKTEATLLEPPTVADTVASPVIWGMVIFSLLVIATLGVAVYQNLRLEKRNRITEIIAATIDPRAAASGRVTGLLTLLVIHVLVAAVVLELGLSVTGKTSVAFALLPGLGWSALALLFTGWTVFALLVWASTVVGSRARITFVSIVGVLTVGGALAPLFVTGSQLTAKIVSWTPFTSPIGIAERMFSGQAAWWEGLVAAAIALVVAVIVHALAGGAYVRSVLRGGGRGGKAVKMSKRAKKVAAVSAGSGSATDEDLEEGAETTAAESAEQGTTASAEEDSDGATPDDTDDSSSDSSQK